MWDSQVSGHFHLGIIMPSIDLDLSQDLECVSACCVQYFKVTHDTGTVQL